MRTLTTNGDVAYTSTMDANLDFFGQAASKRGDNELVVDMFAKAFDEDREMAIKNLCKLRDARGGSGERASSRACLKWLADRHPEVFIGLVKNQFVELGRWDDIVMFAGHPIVGRTVLTTISDQLVADLNALREGGEGAQISLLAKWMPTESSKNPQTKALARLLARKLCKGDYKLYRSIVARLRKNLKLIETHLTEMDYSFEYAKVPSKASMKYTKAFIRNDEHRFNEHIEAMNGNKELMAEKAKRLYPYEMVRKASYRSNRTEKEFANAMWNSLPKDVMTKTCLVVRDGSGSMMTRVGDSSVTALDISTSLAIYMSERLKGAFKDKFITFSSRPQVVDLSDLETLSDKVSRCERYTDVSNTNIEKVYDLIFNTAVLTGGKDIPDYILVASDMEFDRGCENDISTLNAIKRKFEDAGYQFPIMIWWNLNCRRTIFPTTQSNGNIFISGFDTNIFDQITTSDELIFSASKLMTDSLEKYSKYTEGLF